MVLKTALIAAICAGSSVAAEAQTVPHALSDSVRLEFNNFSHEMQTCQVYNIVAFQCFGQRDPELAAAVQKNAQAFGELALNSAKIVGLSEKALVARSDILVQEMKDDISGDCINISVLLNKHARQCKAAMEGSNARIEAILKKMK